MSSSPTPTSPTQTKTETPGFIGLRRSIPADLVERLLAAVANDDEDAANELRELDENWFHVAWTLALLLRGVHGGEPAAVDLVEYLIQSSREA